MALWYLNRVWLHVSWGYRWYNPLVREHPKVISASSHFNDVFPLKRNTEFLRTLIILTLLHFLNIFFTAPGLERKHYYWASAVTALAILAE